MAPNLLWFEKTAPARCQSPKSHKDLWRSSQKRSSMRKNSHNKWPKFFSGKFGDIRAKIHQGCGVGGKISDSDSNSDLSKISDSDSWTQKEWNLTVKNHWKSWCIARNLCFNKSFKRSCTISTGILNLGVHCDVKNDPIGHPESESENKSDSDSTQKPPTPYDSGSDSATQLCTPKFFLLLHLCKEWSVKDMNRFI